MTAGKRDYVGHTGIVLYYSADLLDGIVHGRERGILRTLHSSDDGAGILLREKPFRHVVDQHHIECDGQYQGDHGDGGVIQNPGQAAPINGLDPGKRPLVGQVNSAMFSAALALENIGAHHGRRGQRDDHGNEDGGREGNGELPK